MDIIQIIKALGIGTFGAGGYYFFVAFVVHYFPLPLLRYAKDRALTFLSQKHQKKGDWADRSWKIVQSLLSILIAVMWWGFFGVYVYLLYRMLDYYLIAEGTLFYIYFGISLVFPSIWALVRFINFYRKPTEYSAPNEGNKEDLPLLEQMS